MGYPKEGPTGAICLQTLSFLTEVPYSPCEQSRRKGEESLRKAVKVSQVSKWKGTQKGPLLSLQHFTSLKKWKNICKHLLSLRRIKGSQYLQTLSILPWCTGHQKAPYTEIPRKRSILPAMVILVSHPPPTYLHTLMVCYIQYMHWMSTTIQSLKYWRSPPHLLRTIHLTGDGHPISFPFYKPTMTCSHCQSTSTASLISGFSWCGVSA